MAHDEIEKKLASTRRRWKKTVGERMLRLIGIALALIAIAVGVKYALEFSPRVPVLEPRYTIRQQQPPLIHKVLLIAPKAVGNNRGQVTGLAEALESYYGVTVVRATGGASDTLLAGVGGVIVYGSDAFGAGGALAKLLRSAVDRRLPVFWFGEGFSRYAQLLGAPTFQEQKTRTTPVQTKLIYKGVKLPAVGLNYTPGLDMDAAKQGKVVATLTLYDTFTRPAIIQFERAIYVPFTPFSRTGSMLASAVTVDALGRMFGEHRPDPRVILRLEDVNPVDYGGNDGAFVKVGKYLLRNKIPFSVGIIPIMMDGNGKFVTDIRSAKAVLAFIKAHRSQIEVVQHGTMHYRDDPRNAGKPSGVAYEFFFNDDQAMGVKRAQLFTSRRLKKGYDVMARAGLEPRMFEAPHLEMSPSEQTVADRMFPIMMHPPLSYGESHDHYTAILPWFTQRGDTVYAPSDVGYVHGGDEQGSIDDILGDLRELKEILPDPIVVVFYHPFLVRKKGGEAQLKELVQGAEKLGYRFVNVAGELKTRGKDGGASAKP